MEKTLIDSGKRIEIIKKKQAQLILLEAKLKRTTKNFEEDLFNTKCGLGGCCGFYEAAKEFEIGRKKQVKEIKKLKKEILEGE